MREEEKLSDSAQRRCKGGFTKRLVWREEGGGKLEEGPWGER